MVCPLTWAFAGTFLRISHPTTYKLAMMKMFKSDANVVIKKQVCSTLLEGA